jgi:hypothetical protein
MTPAELDELRRDALNAMREILSDPKSKPADRLRAADIVARIQVSSAESDADVCDLDDAVLLGWARGEGGHPPKRGPIGGTAGAVPSQPPTEHPHSPTRDADEPDPFAGLAGPTVPRETSTPMLERGPKRDPLPTATPGGPKSNPHKAALDAQIAKRKPGRPKKNPPTPEKGPDGTQKGPAHTEIGVRPVALSAEMGEDSAPWL